MLVVNFKIYAVIYCNDVNKTSRSFLLIQFHEITKSLKMLVM